VTSAGALFHFSGMAPAARYFPSTNIVRRFAAVIANDRLFWDGEIEVGVFPLFSGHALSDCGSGLCLVTDAQGLHQLGINLPGCL
jgi:hypothetical protein